MHITRSTLGCTILASKQLVQQGLGFGVQRYRIYKPASGPTLVVRQSGLQVG